ncbi:MAG: hypothetical protein KC464_21730 [Myxococcales bacterium]|nr:hypothetical protein [Myxococcales bacterium]
MPHEVPIQALVEIADWLLDLALAATYGCPDDASAIQRVRDYVHGLADGVRPGVPTEEELLGVIAMVVVALEQRHGLEGLAHGVAVGFDAATYGEARRGPRVAPHSNCEP